MNRRVGYLVVIVVVAGLAAFLLMYLRTPSQPTTPTEAVRGVVPDNPAPAKLAQPITFSHKSHLKDLQCQSCHENAAPGILAGIAATSTCMTCHADRSMASADKPDVKKLVEYDKSQKPIPWVRVYTLRPGVKWAHRNHVDASITCEECHGQVAEMEVTTEVTSVASKFGCLNCHATRKAATSCVSCHPWYQRITVGAPTG